MPLIAGKYSPLWEYFVPSVGTFHSQTGNICFLTREQISATDSGTVGLPLDAWASLAFCKIFAIKDGELTPSRKKKKQVSL